jgi:hypothetical protein
MTFNAHSDLLRRLEFRSELFGWIFSDRRKEVTVDATEMALNALLAGNAFDAIDRRSMTLVKGLGAIEATDLDQRPETVVGLRC